MKKLYFKKIVQSSDDAIISKNLDGIVTTWNASAENMFGYTSKEMIGSPILKLSDPEFLDEEKILLEQISIGQHVTHFETQRVCKDGSVINISVTLSPIFDEKKIIGVSKIIRDITERKKTEALLQSLANTDPLTGLFNRRVFFERLEQEIAKVARLPNYLVVLLILDLDFFKRINDTYGHSVGDDVLKEFANIASNNVRSVDVLARLGGEEFAILLIGADKNKAQIMAERLRERVEGSAIDHKLGSIKYTISIGADCIFTDEVNGEAVINRADAALFEAKEKGRNKICWFPTEEKLT
jgi:two-component system, cell cycle response regulator